MKADASTLRLMLAAGLAAIGIALPIHSFLTAGPFGWHIKQPAAWQGGLEVLLLAAAVLVALSLRGRWARALVAFAALEFFGRRHGIDLSILIVWAYVEGMFALGWWLLPVAGFRRFARPSTLLVAGLLGVIAWSLAIWGSSALGYGTIDHIRAYAVAMLGPALLAVRRPLLTQSLVRSMGTPDKMRRAAFAFAIAFVFAMFAKAAVVIDSDSFWYGLQGEKVLVGAGNLYRGQGLVAIVHYYPKLYEALLLPLSGFGSASIIFGLGIASAVLVMATVAAILREFGVDRTLRLCFAVAAGTIPALANIAVSAKGDAFSAWLMLLGVLAFIRMQKSGNGQWFWIAASALLLSVLARLSNLPYAALLGSLLLFRVFAMGWRGAGWPVLRNRGAYVFGASAMLALLVLARSYVLAGAPLVAPSAVVAWENALGMTLKFPAGPLRPDVWRPRLPVLDGLWNILLDPTPLPHFLIDWTANVWLFVPLAALLLGAVPGRVRSAWPVMLLGLSFFPLLFGYRFVVKGGDGNYFLVPIACLLIAGAATCAAAIPQARRRGFEWLLAAFIVSDAAIAFVTGSWGPGTRGFDTVMTRTPFDWEPRADAALAVARMGGVASFFAGKPPGTRVAGIEIYGRNTVAGGWLPVQYESLHPFLWQQPALVRSSGAIADFLDRAGIEYFVMPTTPSPSPLSTFDTRARDAVHSLLRNGRASVAFSDRDYTIVRLTPERRAATHTP